MKYLISWICWKISCFFQKYLNFYFKKLVADIKTWSKNIIKLDSIFVLSTSLITTIRPLFYWLCISRYIYSMVCICLQILKNSSKNEQLYIKMKFWIDSWKLIYFKFRGNFWQVTPQLTKIHCIVLPTSWT